MHHSCCRGLSVERQAALDLAAETFAQALRHARRFSDPGDGNASPWLYGIAKNLLSGYQRKCQVENRARRKLGILDETTFSVDEVALSDERIDALRRRPEL